MTSPQPSRPALTAVTEATPHDEVEASDAEASDDQGTDSGALTVAALTNELPEFATVMRGYDRGQVEDYVVRLQEFLHDAEVRAAHSDRRVTQGQRRVTDLERELARASQQESRPAAVYDGLGERIGTILRLAAEEAESIRTQARDEADALRDKTRSECDQQRLTAEHDLADITRRRDGVVSELNRVRDVLATLGVAQAPAGAEPAAALSTGDEPRNVADKPDSGRSLETTVLNQCHLQAAGER